jgi:hypothetical protein
MLKLGKTGFPGDIYSLFQLPDFIQPTRKGLEGCADPEGLHVPEGNGAQRNPGKPGFRGAPEMRPDFLNILS